jgi:DNA-binding response OmpR family regulator
MHILVIENDSDTREVLCCALNDAGYTTLEAAKVSDGLRVARLNPEIGVVLLDIHLGDRLTGLEILAPLRSRLNFAQFILVSGDWESLERDIKDVRILRKPCGRAEILRVVQDAFADFQTSGGTASAPSVIRRQFLPTESQTSPPEE